jgi:endo-1,4-beta-xylanase
MKHPHILPIACAGGLLIAHLGCGGGKTPVSPTTSPAASGPSGIPGLQAEPLREAGSASGKLVGAAVKSGLLGDANYAGVLRRHFNYLTAEFEMKWDAIERTRGINDFGAGDAIVSFGLTGGMQVKGHALIWHGSMPPWLAALPAADFRAAFEAHIKAVAEHFRGRVVAWDVVNEAVADDGSGLRDTVFRQKLGEQYIADAFRLARQADPQARLYYNDYGGEGLGVKSDRIYTVVQGLRAQGVPIDGVGLQMHVTATGAPSDAGIAANIRRLTGLGLSVNISEMDVRIRDVPGTIPARLDVQKAVYKSIVGVCVAEPRCEGVTFWGFTDAYSWIDAQFGADDPLLFDEQYAVKPAYYGVLDALWRR